MRHFTIFIVSLISLVFLTSGCHHFFDLRHHGNGHRKHDERHDKRHDKGHKKHNKHHGKHHN